MTDRMGGRAVGGGGGLVQDRKNVRRGKVCVIEWEQEWV